MKVFLSSLEYNRKNIETIFFTKAVVSIVFQKTTFIPCFPKWKIWDITLIYCYYISFSTNHTLFLPVLMPILFRLFSRFFHRKARAQNREQYNQAVVDNA